MSAGPGIGRAGARWGEGARAAAGVEEPGICSDDTRKPSRRLEAIVKKSPWSPVEEQQRAAGSRGEQGGAPAGEEAGRRGKLGRGAGWDRGGSRPAPFGERGGAGEAQDPGRRLCRGFHL